MVLRAHDESGRIGAGQGPSCVLHNVPTHSAVVSIKKSGIIRIMRDRNFKRHGTNPVESGLVSIEMVSLDLVSLELFSLRVASLKESIMYS